MVSNYLSNNPLRLFVFLCNYGILGVALKSLILINSIFLRVIIAFSQIFFAGY